MGKENSDMVSARLETKNLIKDLSKKIPELEDHLFQSIHNVQLDTMAEYKYLGEHYNFLDRFKNKK